MTSPGKQLAVDRSLLNEAFTLGRIQGVWVVWEPDDMFRLYGSINDGLGSGEANGAVGFDCCGNDKNVDQHPVAVVKSQSLKGLGMLVDDANQDGQFIFRAQFQLMF